MGAVSAMEYNGVPIDTYTLARLREGGCLLADEVGLAETIEAGLVMA